MGILRTDWIGRGLAVWVAWVLQRRGLVLVLAAVAGALSLGYARGHLGINTDTADMISPSLPWRQDFIAYREAFPSRDRNLLVVVDAPAPVTAERFAAALAKRLKAMPELYPSVFVVGGGEFFERNGLLYLSLPELESLTDRLAAAQPLIGQLENGLSGVAVLDLAGEAAARSVSASAQAVEGLFAALTATLDAASRGAREPLDWRALFAPGTEQRPRAMLLIRPRLEFDRAQPAELAIGQLREQIAELQKAFPQTDARLTGTVAMEHEELVSVTRGASFAGLLALGMVVGILFLGAPLGRHAVAVGRDAAARPGRYRSIRRLRRRSSESCSRWRSPCSTSGSASISFCTLVLRLKELCAARRRTRCGDRRDRARRRARRSRFVRSRRCAGFYSFIPTPFKGVSELGIISGTGMFISLFVSVTLLPALLGTFYRAPKASRRRAMAR